MTLPKEEQHDVQGGSPVGGKDIASASWVGISGHPSRASRRYVHQVTQRDDLRQLVSPESRGPKYAPDDPHLQFVRPGDRGLAALLKRHNFVTQSQFDKYAKLIKAGERDRPRRSIFGLPMLSPESAVARTWMAFMLLVDLVYTAFIVPVNVAFCTLSYGKSLHDGCTKVDFFGGVVYMTNMIIMFQLGIVLIRKNYKVTVMDGWDVARLYVTSYRFLLDFISTIPFIYLIIILSIEHSYHNNDRASVIHLLSLLRLARLIRMLSISKMITLDTASGTYKKIPWIGQYLTVPIMYTTLLVFFLMLGVNFMACILVLETNLQPPDKPLFFDSVDFISVRDQPRGYKWYFSVYWVITTATGTGYGDVSPKNEVEQVIANVNMILGVLMFGLLVGAVGNGLTRASASAHQAYQHQKKVAEVDDWLQRRDLDEILRGEIQAYFLQYYKDRSVRDPEQDILSDLPSHLRDCALAAIACPLVAQVHGLQLLSVQLQSLLAGCMRAVSFLPGHDICVQGSDADRLWIVENGAVIVLQYEEPTNAEQQTQYSMSRTKMLSRYSRISSASHPAEKLSPHQAGPIDTRYSPCFVPLSTPCLLGESIIFADEIPACRQRLVTYRAIQPCNAWELRLTDLWPLLRAYPQIKVTMLTYLRNRLCRDIIGANVDPSNHYCELSVTVASALTAPDADQTKLQDLVVELSRADIESGELYNILANLAEVSSVQPWARPDAGQSDGWPMASRSPTFHTNRSYGGAGNMVLQQDDYPVERVVNDARSLKSDSRKQNGTARDDTSFVPQSEVAVDQSNEAANTKAVTNDVETGTLVGRRSMKRTDSLPKSTSCEDLGSMVASERPPSKAKGIGTTSMPVSSAYVRTPAAVPQPHSNPQLGRSSQPPSTTNHLRPQGSASDTGAVTSASYSTGSSLQFRPFSAAVARMGSQGHDSNAADGTSRFAKTSVVPEDDAEGEESDTDSEELLDDETRKELTAVDNRLFQPTPLPPVTEPSQPSRELPMISEQPVETLQHRSDQPTVSLTVDVAQNANMSDGALPLHASSTGLPTPPAPVDIGLHASSEPHPVTTSVSMTTLPGTHSHAHRSLFQSSTGSQSSMQSCFVCGHAVCPACAQLVHPASPGPEREVTQQLRSRFATTPRNDPRSPTDPSPGRSLARHGLSDMPVSEPAPRGSALSHTMLARRVTSRSQTPGPWRPRALGSLERSSSRLGTTSIDRYRNLGITSIPLQQM